MSEYATIQKSAMKLKGVGSISAGKKKKKKDKESKHRLEQVATSQKDEEVKTKKAYVDKRTPAQIAFDKMQEKRPRLKSVTHSNQTTMGHKRVKKPLCDCCRMQMGGVQMERILNKASKTHKHRVEDFNRHLDTLTEHYDIPKVSWTK